MSNEVDSAPEEQAQAYFHALELQFARLRGSAVLLSPADWKLAQDWFERGIPLDLVVRTLELVLARRAERAAQGSASKRRVSSLRYFAPAVDAAWEELRSLTAPGHIGEPPPLDVPGRLAALADALPVTLRDRATWQSRVRSILGAPPEVEAALGAIDRALLAEGAAALGEEERRQLDAALAQRMASLVLRLPAAEIDRAREHLRTRLVRQALRLPILSLFTDARADPTESTDRSC